MRSSHSSLSLLSSLFILPFASATERDYFKNTPPFELPPVDSSPFTTTWDAQPIRVLNSTLMGHMNLKRHATNPAHYRSPLVKRASVRTYPPSAWFNINDLTTIYDLSELMVKRMMDWYVAPEIPNFKWSQEWQMPVLGMALVNLDMAFGNNGNQQLVNDLIRNNRENNFVVNVYIDDQSWWANYALRAYQAYGDATLINSVKGLISTNEETVDDTCGGGPRWQKWLYDEKNTITTTLHLSALTRMYRVTGERYYYEEAVKTLNWWLSWAFEPSSGRIWDTIKAPECMNDGRHALGVLTYNSAPILQALADLYYATGDETLLDLGRSIAYSAMRDFAKEGGVLKEYCEDNESYDPNQPSGCGNDPLAFKGILTMALAEFYLARPDPNLYNFINTQLLSIIHHDLDASWLAGPRWAGPFDVNTSGPKTQINALCAVAAVAMVNADFLARTGHDSSGKKLPVDPTGGGGDGSGGGGGGGGRKPLPPVAPKSASSGVVKEVGWSVLATLLLLQLCV